MQEDSVENEEADKAKLLPSWAVLYKTDELDLQHAGAPGNPLYYSWCCEFGEKCLLYKMVHQETRQYGEIYSCCEKCLLYKKVHQETHKYDRFIHAVKK